MGHYELMSEMALGGRLGGWRGEGGGGEERTCDKQIRGGRGGKEERGRQN